MTRSYRLDPEASQQNRLDVEAIQAKVIVEGLQELAEMRARGG